MPFTNLPNVPFQVLLPKRSTHFGREQSTKEAHIWENRYRYVLDCFDNKNNSTGCFWGFLLGVGLWLGFRGHVFSSRRGHLRGFGDDLPGVAFRWGSVFKVQHWGLGFLRAFLAISYSSSLCWNHKCFVPKIITPRMFESSIYLVGN